jgi:hypothetical protein
MRVSCCSSCRLLVPPTSAHVYAASRCAGDTPLLYIAREGHYKYPPAEIPALLIQSGANMEAKDSAGRTALQVRGMLFAKFQPSTMFCWR